jgi:hypothetical protein
MPRADYKCMAFTKAGQACMKAAVVPSDYDERVLTCRAHSSAVKPPDTCMCGSTKIVGTDKS